MFSTCECLTPISYIITFLVNNNDNIDKSNNGKMILSVIYTVSEYLFKKGYLNHQNCQYGFLEVPPDCYHRISIQKTLETIDQSLFSSQLQILYLTSS